ncbi:MAG: membrane protein insertase YidC [Alistipes sp.]|nr:membrane protein insertase YidC [Candidatus Alistipes equi]
MENNKQSVIAFVLITVIFFAFMLYNGRMNAKYEEEQQKAKLEQAMEQMTQVASESVNTPNESVNTPSTQPMEQSPVEEVQPQVEPQDIETATLENDVLRIEFTSLGGRPYDVVLKEYTKYAPKNERNELVHLFQPETSSFSVSMYIRQQLRNVQISTGDKNFSIIGIDKRDDASVITFRLSLEEDAWIDYIYTLYQSGKPERDYMLDYKIAFHNIAPLMANQTSIGIDWTARTFQNERSYKNENMYTTLVYHFPNEIGVEDLGIGNAEKEKNVGSALDWVSFKQQYFSSTLIALDKKLSYADMAYTTEKEGSGFIKKFEMHSAVAYTPQTSKYDFSFYFGPNKFAVLKSITNANGESLSLERIIPLGWVISTIVSRWLVIPTFDFLREYISSFGLIILLLTIMVKILISPLTYKSYLSTAKMRVIKPEIDQLNEKYPKQSDAMKKQQETMALYRKAGINPMGGCLPMLIQMPIIIAMFRFFPASIELRGQSFLWSSDLSSYDSILQLPFSIPFYGDHVSLFALLMAVSMYFMSYMTYQQTSSQPGMAGMKFMTLYIMPVMMLFWFNDYSSGLCYYYFLSTLITIAQTFIIRRMIDDEKLHNKIKAHMKNNNGKKSRFQMKLEEKLKEREARR